jgi:hypothetical protein
MGLWSTNGTATAVPREIADSMMRTHLQGEPTPWSKDEPRKIAQSDDLHIAPYRDSPYLSPMISVRARSATIKVMPRETSA